MVYLMYRFDIAESNSFFLFFFRKIILNFFKRTCNQTLHIEKFIGFPLSYSKPRLAHHLEHIFAHKEMKQENILNVLVADNT